MKTKLITQLAALLLLSTLNFQLSTAFGQGTAFTYQGKLASGGSAVSGVYDFTFAVWNAASGGAQQGATFATNAVPVTNGYFAATLDVGNVFTGNALWLEIAVRTNGASSFTTLTPRQPITPAPYAIMANSASNLLGALPSTQVSGTIPASQLSGTFTGNVIGSATSATTATTANNFSGSLAGDVTGPQSVTVVSSVGGQNAATIVSGVSAANAATSANTANTIVKRDSSGNFTAGVISANSFTGNGASVTNVNAAAVGGLDMTNLWHLDGNNVAAGQFLGSTNNQALEFRVNNLPALRLEPTANDAHHSNIVNFVGGAPVNYIASGVYGSVIAGGGAANYFGGTYSNSIFADCSFLGGGIINSIQADSRFSFLGGGNNNSIHGVGSFLGACINNSIQADAYDSFLGAGWGNSIQTNASYSFLGGGLANSISGAYGVVPGGDNNAAGTNSFAAGHRAKANHTGAFVWADSTDADFASTVNNQFSVRATGGVRFVTSGGGVTVDGASIFTGNNGSGLTSLNPASLSAGTAGINISGNASTATSATTATTANNFSGSLAGDVTGTQGATVVSTVGGSTAVNIHAAEQSANAATSAATANAIVRRNVSGSFTSASITLTGNLNLPATTAGAGIVYSGGSTLIHAYGNDNFFAGSSAGNLTLTGSGNTGVGSQVLPNDTTGVYNTANGVKSLYYNTVGTGNTAGGYQALYNTVNGHYNTAVGISALQQNTNGSHNIALGDSAGLNVTGNNNIDIGNPGVSSDNNIIRIGTQGTHTATYLAGTVYATGNLNLPATTAGAGIVYSGGSTLIHAYGNDNFFAGSSAGNLTLTGSGNTGVGSQVLPNDTTGVYNTANGVKSLYYNTVGTGNTAGGYQALYNTVNGHYNTAVGISALQQNTNGSHNIALGDSAGLNVTGNNNIDIGNPGVSTDNNIIRIGSGQTSTYLAGNSVHVPGMLRLGSETNTASGPSYPSDGLVIRRISCTGQAVSNLLARTDALMLTRDGTAAGLAINYSIPGAYNQNIVAIGIDNGGVQHLYKNTLVGPGSGTSTGTLFIFNNSLRIVHYDVSFGNVYNSGHTCHVILDRYDDGSTSDNYMVGYLTSTYNQ